MHHKAISSYKYLVGGLLVFFFGLTLGLTLGVTNSNNSFNTASEAETPGNLKNVYCRMTRSDLNASVWRWCTGNTGEKGYMGWESIADNHSTTNETTIKVGNAITLSHPVGSNPKNTNCSVVQHDGLDSQDDVWVQYSADALNYCVINYNPNKQNFCVQNGIKKNITSSSQEADKPGSELNNWIKAQFDTKCKPQAQLATTCGETQSYGKLSIKMAVSKIDPAYQFEKNEWLFCMTPKTNANHAKVYNEYFLGKATYKPTGTGLPAWACYRIGNTNTYLNPANDFMTRYFDASQPIDYGNGTNKKYIDDMALWMQNQNIPNTEFSTKINLWAGGTFNDQINSGNIKINPTACGAYPTPTQQPSPTPPVASCTYTTVVHTPTSEEYVWSGGVVKTVDNYSLPKIDKSKAIKIAADWGWAGETSNQQGPVDIVAPILSDANINNNGNEIQAEVNYQKNETSKVYLKYYNSSNVPTLLGNSTVNCPDVGDWKFSTTNYTTPFADGRIVTYNGVTTNLNNPITGGGKWYTCPTAVTTKPAESTAASKVWKTAAIMPANAKDKVQIVREYTGENIGTSNNSLKGSSYSRVSIQYCQLP